MEGGDVVLEEPGIVPPVPVRLVNEVRKEVVRACAVLEDHRPVAGEVREPLDLALALVVALDLPAGPVEVKFRRQDAQALQVLLAVVGIGRGRVRPPVKRRAVDHLELRVLLPHGVIEREDVRCVDIGCVEPLRRVVGMHWIAHVVVRIVDVRAHLREMAAALDVHRKGPCP